MMKLRNVVLYIAGLFLMGAVAVETVSQLYIEPRTIASWGELADIYYSEREELPPLPLQTGDVINQMAANDWSFLSDHWQIRQFGGTYYVAKKSELAKKLKLPLTVRIFEDVRLGEVFIMSSTDGTNFQGEVAFTAPELVTDDASLKTLYALGSNEVLTEQEKQALLFWELSPRRVIWEITLKTEDDAWTDVLSKTSSLSAENTLLLDGGGMMAMMSVPEEYTNDIWLALETQTNGINLNIFAPEGFTNRVEVYSCTDLVSGVWTVAGQNLYPSGTNPAVWDASATLSNRFLRAGNMDIDSDGDGLPDARERIVYKTNPESMDTDGDGYRDDWEVEHGINPLSVNLVKDGDADSDGYPNVYEYVYGTDPLNSNSIPTATRYVSSSGSNTAPFASWETAANTIQAAIDTATNDYEIILVADGTYSGTGNKELDFHGKKLLLRSENGPSDCVIDCGWGNTGMVFDSGETRETAVWGMQISYAGEDGILCSNASPLVMNCTLSQNNNSGIRSIGGSPLVKDCLVEDNYGYNGAAGYFDGGSPELNDCSVYNHWVYEGGSLFFTNCETAVVSGAVLSGNHRGTILCEQSTIQLNDCEISANDNNQYALSSGAVFKNSNVTIYNCTVQSNVNSVGTAPRTGGGFYFLNSTSLVQNCLIAANGSELSSSVVEGGEAYFRNCTIADNDGFGLCGISNAQIAVQNTIVWGNSSGAIESDTQVDVTFSCVSGINGTGNITNSPEFTAGGYMLSAISPCIDTASSSNAPPTDLMGNSRWDRPTGSNVVTQSIVDMGAFEFSDADVDDDGIGDAWEVCWFGDTSVSPLNDSDNDGLSLLDEYLYFANPTLSDTDGDTLSDGDEVNVYACNPADADSDRDGLSDSSEINLYFTSPTNADSDNDNMGDGWEIRYDFNALSNSDALNDVDNDGLSNAAECLAGTNPYDADSDNDGLIDGSDSNPLVNDTPGAVYVCENPSEYQAAPCFKIHVSVLHSGWPPGVPHPISGPNIYANGELIMPAQSGYEALSYDGYFYARPGEKLVITHDPLEGMGHVDVYTLNNCTRDDTALYPFTCSYHVETGGQTNSSMIIGVNADDDNGDNVPDCENEIIDGAADRNDMGRLVVDEFFIHPDAPMPGVRIATGTLGTPEAGLRFFKKTGELITTNSFAEDIPDAHFYFLVEGTNTGTKLLGLAYENAADYPEISNTTYGGQFGVSVISVGMTAYRPTTEGPAYGIPLGKHEVPDDQEEMPGAGIRVNGDSESATNENDLIEVEIKVEPYQAPSGLTYVLKRNSSNIKVWDSQTMGTPILDSGTEATITFSSATKTVWVENPSGGSADLELVARSGTADICSDKIHFYSFSSVVVLFEGEFGIPSDPPGGGVSTLALAAYTNGYDVHVYDEPDLFETPNTEDAAFAEIDSAVENRGVTAVALIGYSHGGGSTYNVSVRLDADATAFNLAFTAYIDAISQPLVNITAEDRRPVASAFHVNYYQVAQINDSPLFLDGAPSTPTGIGFEDNVDDPTVTESHTTIDDSQIVRDGISTRLLQQVNR